MSIGAVAYESLAAFVADWARAEPPPKGDPELLTRMPRNKRPPIRSTRSLWETHPWIAAARPASADRNDDAGLIDPPSDDGCPVGTTLTWHRLDSQPALPNDTMATYTVATHDGDLFAGGIGGVRCWDPDAQSWWELNTGFGPQAWMKQPMVVSMASQNGTLFAVMVNAVFERLHAMDSTGVWTPLPDMPLRARALQSMKDGLYVGSQGGVFRYNPLAELWWPVGQLLDTTVSTFFADPESGELFAGTFDGQVLLYDPFGAAWNAATPIASFGFVHALHRFGDYLYISGEEGLVRCWPEEGWGTGAFCEPLDPQTGLPPTATALAFRVHDGHFFSGTAAGIWQFDGANDSWAAANAGLSDAAGKPLTTFELGTYAAALVVGSVEGVYQYGCW